MADQKVNVIYTVVDKATRGIKSITQSVAGLGKSFLRSKVSLAALTAAVGLAIRDFAQFETAIVNVGNLFGATDDEIQELSDGVIELSKNVSSSSQDLAEALFDVVSAGVEAGESIQFLEAASKLASAGVTTTKVAVDGLTSVMNAFRIESDEVNDISDKFFAAQQRGKTTIEELSTTIGNVAPIAASAGVGIDELLGTISALTLQGIDTARATTGVRATISALLNPTQQAAKLARELNLEFNAQTLEADGLEETLRKVIEATGGNQEAMGVLFGSIEAINTISALASDNFESLSDIQEDVATSAGVTAAAFERQQQTISAQFQILRNNAGALSKGLVEIFTPAINFLLKAFSSFFRITTNGLNRVRSGFNSLRNLIRSGLGLEPIVQANREAQTQITDDTKAAQKAILEAEKKAQSERVQNILDSQKQIEEANSEFFKKQIEMLEDQNLKTSELRDVETSEKIAQLERLLLAEQLNAEDRKTVERNISRLKATLRREEEQGVFALESAKLDTIKRSLAAELKALANSFLLQGIARASFFDPIGVLQIGASVIINEGIDAALSGIKLADGGIVRATPGGVRATIGEGGQDEAVIPLDSPRGRAMLGNNQAREIIIMTDDGTELTRAISGKQNEMLQTGQITR